MEESEKSDLIKCLHSQKVGLDSRASKAKVTSLNLMEKGTGGLRALGCEAHLQEVCREHFPGPRPREGGGGLCDSSLS